MLFLRHRRRVALFTGAAVFGTVGLYELVKVVVGRHRPTVPRPLVHPFGASFPSGHAAMSATAMILLGMVCWQWVRRAWVCALALVAAAVVAAAVAASRLVLGAHYLSDVLGGWLLALTWVALLVAAFGVRPVRPLRRGGVSLRATSAAARDRGQHPAGSAA